MSTKRKAETSECVECGRTVTRNADGDWVDDQGQVMCMSLNYTAYHATPQDYEEED